MHVINYHPDDSGTRGARPYDDQGDCRDDRAPAVPAYGAQDHGCPDRREDSPRHHDYYREDDYTTCIRGDPHQRGDYDPRLDYHAMTVRPHHAHHHGRTTSSPTIKSTIEDGPLVHPIITTMSETSMTDMMTQIVVVRTITLACRRA